jgi:hypothetical protein
MAQRRGIVAPRESLIATEWRSVAEFPAYEVSSAGLVRNDTGLLLKPEIGHRGHLRVTLYNEGGEQRHLVHRLVLSHFVGPAPSEEHECAHWDGDPTNNQVSNLRWATRKENTEDTKRHGRFPLGEKSHFAKLTEARVVEIRERIAGGAATRALAEEFEVDIGQINKIACGLAWAHLGGQPRKRRARNKVDETSAATAIAEIDTGDASIAAAAKRYGISRQTIRRRLAAFGPSEKEIHQAAIEHWRLFGSPGTLVATLANAGAIGQPGLTKGLPDLMVIGPGVPGKIAFIELKRDRASPISQAQLDFARLCLEHEISVIVAYGRDEPIKVLEGWSVVRKAAA